MSDDSQKPEKKRLSNNAKVGLGLTGIFLVAAGITAGINSYKVVNPGEFGLEVVFGKVQDKILQPDFHTKYPLFDTIHTFNNNVIILETRIGDGKNTKDQNKFCASVRLHYQIDPNAGILAFHLDDMSDDNGKDLLINQMSKAMNAVVGARTTPETLIAPAETLKDFVSQLEWRLKQNNIAAKVDTVEYLTAYIGDCSDSDTASGLRLPVQLKLKPGQEVESMAGPSAVPVTRPVAPAPANQ